MSVNISTRVSENNLDASAEKLDEYLVKIANGDREALAAIHQATSDSVCGYALSILKKPHDAQDVKKRVFYSPSKMPGFRPAFLRRPQSVLPSIFFGIQVSFAAVAGGVKSSDRVFTPFLYIR